MADRIIHIAGEPIRVGVLGRQLCAFCGYALQSRNVRHLSFIGPAPKMGFSTWKVGALVEVREGGASHVGVLGEDPVPNGGCWESALAEAVAEEAVGNG
ncbi:MAG TPA: hypothetical protein VJN18_32305 [Polyangiaceae bacterium]|nr:hypothetical protein [Polyangiaceae bacterium]